MNKEWQKMNKCYCFATFMLQIGSLVNLMIRTHFERHLPHKHTHINATNVAAISILMFDVHFGILYLIN